MQHINNKVENIKIAYIGGGSRGWAWGLMSDLATAKDISGEVALYDIDYNAAKANEIIGNKYNSCKEASTTWNYKAVNTIEDALTGADFVIISILPGTFDEMASDVHAPEKYGIYQAVGDTSGPGGIVRAMRTIPMYEYIAEKIKNNCPKAWVISYTNPMTLCVKTLYRVFPQIKAFGCCHEVFGTQHLLATVVGKYLGIPSPNRKDIKVKVTGVNHFTWLTSAKYQNIDIFPIYRQFVEEYGEIGFAQGNHDNWANNPFYNAQKVKMDLFRRYKYIAAAGDRHLAEFCEGKWYLESLERVKEMMFELTSVNWRKKDLEERLEKSRKLVSGELDVSISCTGEEGVEQIRALLGLRDLVTNVNIPNMGQIPNLPIGAVVETNAVFRVDSLEPVFTGNIPREIYPLISRVCGAQEQLSIAISNRNVEDIFSVFINDPLVTCNIDDARKLFNEMIENTKKYLTDYNF